jgi:hypothetical protein
MIADIHLAAPKARLVNARYEPVVGALLLGLEAAGIAAEPVVKENIERGCREFHLLREAT